MTLVEILSMKSHPQNANLFLPFIFKQLHLGYRKKQRRLAFYH